MSREHGNFVTDNGKIEVVIIDERAAPLRPDNTEAKMGSVVMANSAPIVVVIGQDGVFVKEGVGKVSIITPKSEAVMSAEKADRESAAFAARYRSNEGPESISDSDEPLREHDGFADDPVTHKFSRVWEGESNSGTEEITGAE